MSNKLMLLAAVLLTGFLAAGCSEEAVQTGIADEPTRQDLEARVQELQDQLTQKEEAVASLRSELEQVRGQLPEPHPVERGDTHWEIAKRYLTEDAGLEPEAAERELAKSALLDPILEGQEVWNYYDDSIFGTFVVQDEAPVSPGAIRRAQLRDAEEAAEERERLSGRVAELQDELRAEQARRSGEVERLEAQIRTKTGEVDSLRSYIDSLRQHHEALRADVLDLTERLHSVYYLAGTEAELKAQKKVAGSFLRGARLGELESADFERRLDLRETAEIRLTADELGVRSIEDVDVLPSYWESGRDYQVNISSGGEIATIELLDEDQFRLRTLVLMVNS